LDIYSKTNIHPARERQIRILSKTGQQKKATELAKVILQSPENIKEEIFAQDFLNADGKRLKKSTTVSLKGAEVITLTKKDYNKVEELVIDYFENQDYKAYHTENGLWRFLFGLIFWEETYDLNKEAFHHPLQRNPISTKNLFYTP